MKIYDKVGEVGDIYFEENGGIPYEDVVQFSEKYFTPIIRLRMKIIGFLLII